VARILVLGSVARDEVVRLRHPLRAGTHMEAACSGPRLGGGGACTAVPLAHAGHHVTLISAIGDDDDGSWLLEQLQATRVDTSQIRRIEGASTRSLVMVDERGERSIVNLTRATEPQPPTRLLDLPADCLYVRSRAPELGSLLERKGQQCLVVAHMPPCEAAARPAHVLLASEPDLEPEVLGAPWPAGRRVAGERLEWVVITRGPRGVLAFGPGRRLETPAPHVTPVDTTGSGDAFAAGLVHALVGGSAIEQALEAGAAWGAENARWESSILPAQAVARLLRGCDVHEQPAPDPGRAEAQ